MKSVVIWGYVNYKWLHVPLAKELKLKHGAKIHFICSNEQSVENWKRQDPRRVIDTFITTDHFFFEYDRCTESPAEIYSNARENEEKYKTYVVDVLQTDRHLGRGFAAMGPGHTRSQLSEKANYVKSVNLFNNVLGFWEEYFDRTTPDLIIGNASGIIGKTCSVVARSRGIPIRVLILANYQAYHGWAVDEYYSLPEIQKMFESIDDEQCRKLVSNEELVEFKRLPLTDINYQRYSRYKTVGFLLGDIFEKCRAYAYRKYKGVVTMGNYKFSEKIKMSFRVCRDMRAIDFLPSMCVEDLRDKSYIMFPLHVEPESSVGIMSPEMNEQLACIEFLAKNLPAGIQLVIKEHLAAVGRRPKEFYSTILDIPNVIMLSPYAYALDAARGAKAVAVITSTLGMEAAVLGVPVISFGRHNNYNFLPHVHVVDSWMDLRPLLASLCGRDSPEARAKRSADGRRYVAALKLCTIDLGWTDYASQQNRARATEKEVGVIYAALMGSLNEKATPHYGT